MNERIEELKKQAEEYAMAVHDGHILPEPGRACLDFFEVYDEKFAELIVKETLQVARAGMEFGPSMDEAVYTYFGIE